MNTNEDSPNAQPAPHRPVQDIGAEEEEEEEEAVFISVVNTNEDPPNAHQAQHRRRRRWWSVLVIIEGDPLNTQHAQQRSVQATDR